MIITKQFSKWLSVHGIYIYALFVIPETQYGKYAKDTVGEDMELVVRLSRFMRELGHKMAQRAN